MAAIIWLLGFFLLRNFYFTLFEMRARAATPGKRRDGHAGRGARRRRAHRRRASSRATPCASSRSICR